MRMSSIQAKSIRQGYWTPFFKDISIQLGYESMAAQNIAFGVHDLHKADQVLGAFLDSGSQILVQFYQENRTGNGEFNYEEFKSFIDSSSNPNIRLLYDVIFKYTLGYYILKGGIRKSHFDFFMCGKDLVAPVFFGFNHPQYRKLYLYADVDFATMPEQMFQHIKQTIGVKVDGKVRE